MISHIHSTMKDEIPIIFPKRILPSKKAIQLILIWKDGKTQSSSLKKASFHVIIYFVNWGCMKFWKKSDLQSNFSSSTYIRIHFSLTIYLNILYLIAFIFSSGHGDSCKYVLLSHKR